MTLTTVVMLFLPLTHLPAHTRSCMRAQVQSKYGEKTPSAEVVKAEIWRRKLTFKSFLFREPVFSFVLGALVRKIQVGGWAGGRAGGWVGAGWVQPAAVERVSVASVGAISDACGGHRACVWRWRLWFWAKNGANITGWVGGVPPSSLVLLLLAVRAIVFLEAAPSLAVRALCVQLRLIAAASMYGGLMRSMHALHACCTPRAAHTFAFALMPACLPKTVPRKRTHAGWFRLHPPAAQRCAVHRASPPLLAKVFLLVGAAVSAHASTRRACAAPRTQGVRAGVRE
jgi:hypothetical protein